MRDTSAYEGDSTEAFVFRQKILRILGVTQVRAEDIEIVALNGKARAVVNIPGDKFRWFDLLTSGDVQETEGYARS